MRQNHEKYKARKRQQTILRLNPTTQFNRKQNLIGFFSVDREFESHVAKICQKNSFWAGRWIQKKDEVVSFQNPQVTFFYEAFI